MTNTDSLETCVNLYVMAAQAEISLRQAEKELPPKLIGELRERRLKPHVEAFISNYQQAVRVARVIWGGRFKEMEEVANALKGPLTADEASKVARELRIWLETLDA